MLEIILIIILLPTALGIVFWMLTFLWSLIVAILDKDLIGEIFGFIVAMVFLLFVFLILG